MPALPSLTCPHTSLGCSLASEPPLRRLLASPQRSCSTVSLRSFLVSSLVFLSRHWQFSKRQPGQGHPTSQTGVPAPLRSLQRSWCSSKGASRDPGAAPRHFFCVCLSWWRKATLLTCAQRVLCRCLTLPKFFMLDLGDHHRSASMDRLKLHTGLTIFTPATAPCCGCPPLSVAPPKPPPGVGG